MPQHLLVLLLHCLILTLALACTARATEFTGKVVSIADGDTITVLHNGVGEKIRLNGIDCPELGQPFSRKAKKFASTMAYGHMVTVETFGRDKYDRTIGDVLLKGKTVLNQELVRAGMCWWYRKYAPDNAALEQLEAEAREAKRRLWVGKSPVPDWEWRGMRTQYD